MTHSNSSDYDNDGWVYSEEVWIGTNPCDPDTDNDGYSDGYEMENISDSSYLARSNPLDSCDPNPNVFACLAQSATLQER